MNFTTGYHDDDGDNLAVERLPLASNGCRCHQDRFTHLASTKETNTIRSAGDSVAVMCDGVNVNGEIGDHFSECNCECDGNSCEKMSLGSGDGGNATMKRVESYDTSLTEPSSSQTDSFVTVINRNNSAAMTGDAQGQSGCSHGSNSFAGNLESPVRLRDVELSTPECLELDNVELGCTERPECEVYRGIIVIYVIDCVMHGI